MFPVDSRKTIDAVLSLWANYDKYETLKDVAEAINVPYKTVVDNWCAKSRRLSGKTKLYLVEQAFDGKTASYIMKYSHPIQDKLGKKIAEESLSQRQAIQFLKNYDNNPNANLDDLANEVSGIKKIEIPESFYTPELKAKIEEEKKQSTNHTLQLDIGLTNLRGLLPKLKSVWRQIP